MVRMDDDDVDEDDSKNNDSNCDSIHFVFSKRPIIRAQ